MNKCPVCHKSNSSNSRQNHFDYKTQIDYKLYKCPSCDIEYWTPLQMPPNSFYESGAGEYSEFHLNTNSKLKKWHHCFLSHFPIKNNAQKILDVGCGDGIFLKKMQDLGWEIWGIDLDELSVKTAKIKCNSQNIFHLTLEELVKNEKFHHFFDTITFFEVLEHQPSPSEFLSQIKLLLKKNGSIAGSVPNRNRYLFHKRFSPDCPPHHFTLWTSKVLSDFLTKQEVTNTFFKHIRYEPIFINEIIVNLFFEQKQKQEMIRSQQDYSKTDIAKTKLQITKKHLAIPILNLIKKFEYPFLIASKKSICVYFQGEIK